MAFIKLYKPVLERDFFATSYSKVTVTRYINLNWESIQFQLCRQSRYSRKITAFYEYNELRFVKKCKNHTFKVDFLCQKLIDFFGFSFQLKNISLGDPFLLKTFLPTSIFRLLYFIKSCPIFDVLAFPVFTNYNGVLWICWFFS